MPCKEYMPLPTTTPISGVFFVCVIFFLFLQRRFLQEQTDKVNELLDHMKQRAFW